jgi:hypothetical protein
MISYRESQLRKVLDELKPTEINFMGTKIWKNKEGKYHRLNDKPALILINGTKSWYINGELHRENNKPAIEFSDRRKAWYINDKFIKRNYDKNKIIHNDKFFDEYGYEIKTTTAQLRKVLDELKPTQIDKYGNKYWKNEKGYHRGNNKPAVEYDWGGKEWWVNGKFIKQNYDKLRNIYNDRFFNYDWDEIGE